MKKEKEEIMENEDTLRIYEVGFHFDPTISDDKIDSALDSMREIVKSSGAVILSDNIIKEQIDLAYKMDSVFENKKRVFDKAYFGWIKFETTPESIPVIEADIKKNPIVFRFLITKTIRENTIENIAVSHKGDKRQHKTEEIPVIDDDSKKEVSEAEVNEAVDKAIEELVVE